MNISSKELKKMARNQLSGKYGTFIGTNVLYILITLVASNLMDLVLGTSSILNPLTATSATVETLGISHTVVYYLSTFILSLILSVLNIGLLKIALDTARGYDIRFQDLFYGFKHHPDRVILAQGVILLLTYLCILPGSGLCIYGYRQKSVTLLLAGTAVLCVGLVIYLILSLMFSQTMFFLTDYIDIEAMQALKESVRIMRGKKGKFFYLQLSFIGIYLLGAIACGIGLICRLRWQTSTGRSPGRYNRSPDARRRARFPWGDVCRVTLSYLLTATKTLARALEPKSP